jgi:bacterial leucyl aminopeptidase
MDMPPYLTPPEIDILQRVINAEKMHDRIARYAPDSISRNSAHSGNTYAATELYQDLSRTGAPLRASQVPFDLRGRTLHNVEAVLPSAGRAGMLAVSAHLDSTGELDTGYRALIDPAPGADDDASGVAGVLLAARAMVRLAHAYPTVKRREIRFVLFNAEEDGQVGSGHYVRALRAARANVLGAFQMDMIAFARGGQRAFEIHAGYADAEYIQEASVKLAKVIEHVCPAVSPGITPQILTTTRMLGDSSDHASFHAESYPACVVTEDHLPGNGGPGHPNPARHTADDVLDTAKLNMKYAADVARAVAAAAWYHATR